MTHSEMASGSEMASAKSDPEDEMFEGLVHFIVHLWGMGHPRIPKGAFKDHEVHRIELDTSLINPAIKKVLEKLRPMLADNLTIDFEMVGDLVDSGSDDEEESVGEDGQQCMLAWVPLIIYGHFQRAFHLHVQRARDGGTAWRVAEILVNVLLKLVVQVSLPLHKGGGGSGSE